jgi:hypothetical protein
MINDTFGTNLTTDLPPLLAGQAGDGGQLYVCPDGVHWSLVFTAGLGNSDDYGVRNMVAADGTLFLGMCNVLDLDQA